MSRADIDAKLRAVCERVLDTEQTAGIRDAWWTVEHAANIGDPIKMLVWS